MTPKVVLLGRPNVGKSTLFNRLIRSNRAITHDRPGITRDRMEGTVRSRFGRTFTLVDTGGITLDGHQAVVEGPAGIRGFEEDILRQAEAALAEADLICLVVDARDGLTPFDEHLAAHVRRSGKPIFVVVNKVDGLEHEERMLAEFYALGFPLLAVSAEHGHNIRALEETMREYFPEETADDLVDAEIDAEMEKALSEMADDANDGDDGDATPALPPAGDSGPLKLCMLGRPNAGKSSLVNAFLGSDRMIVSDEAGTTRDSVDVPMEKDGMPYIFVDTAGVRRRARITDTVERFSVNSAIKSTTKAHVTMLVLDASEPLSAQDKRLAELLDTRKTPFMVLLNKIDLVPGKERAKRKKDFEEELAFCAHVPIVTVSALKGQGLGAVFPLARLIHKECSVRIPTSQLNRALEGVLKKHEPPIVRRSRPKFFYMTQAESSPPTFVFFVSDADRVNDPYVRYLEKSLRQMFGIKHAPMRVHLRSSHKKKDKKKK